MSLSTVLSMIYFKHITTIATRFKSTGYHKVFNVNVFFVEKHTRRSGSGSFTLFSLVRTLSAHVPGRSITSLAVSGSEEWCVVGTTCQELLAVNLAAVVEREDRNIDTVLGKGWLIAGDAVSACLWCTEHV